MLYIYKSNNINFKSYSINEKFEKNVKFLDFFHDLFTISNNIKSSLYILQF